MELEQKTKIITGDAANLDVTSFPLRYGVIVADPPWPYRQSKSLKGGVNKHYVTMTDDDIVNMPVKSLAMSNSILLLWGTWPKLPAAVRVMESWGFNYLTGFPWIKTTKNGAVQSGIGFWVRGCSEFVFIGRRGEVRAPEAGSRFAGLLSPNLGHSMKPESIYDIAETLPGPYLEIFARRSRAGWHSFGNEVEDVTTGVIHTPSNNGVNPTAQPRLFALG